MDDQRAEERAVSLNSLLPDAEPTRGARVRELAGKREARRQPRQPGSAKGKLLVLSEDEEHLKDLKDYMS